jgi:hypothetical protein
LLGSSERYTEIVELNKTEYPTLETNPRNLSVGWELKLPCEGEEPGKTSEDSSQPDVLTVDVKIKVINEQKTPVGGASVTLHSTPREAVTDDTGVALFENVELGEHTAIIAYKGQTGEQKINVQAEGDIEEISFTIQIKSTSPFLEPAVMVVVGGLALALVSTLAVLVRKK